MLDRETMKYGKNNAKRIKKSRIFSNNDAKSLQVFISYAKEFSFQLSSFSCSQTKKGLSFPFNCY